MVGMDLITGFLGAGKTTLINKLLSEAHAGEKPVLIENEFGDVSIDDSLIEDPQVQVRLLSSGCICCTLKGGFVQGITEVVRQYQPSRIIIEPTGLADPTDILDACREAAQAVPVRVETLITVANAQTLLPLLEVSGELFRRQLSEAEVIVLSCTQLISPEELAQVGQAIRELNPGCVLVDQDWKALDALALLSLAEEARVSKEEGKCPACGHDHRQERGHEHHGHEHHGHEHHGHDHCGHDHGSSTEGYSSLAFFPEQTFSSGQIGNLFAALAGGSCGLILRAKGFLRKPAGGYSHVEYVYGTGSARDCGYTGQPKFVCIGEELRGDVLGALMGKE